MTMFFNIFKRFFGSSHAEHPSLVLCEKKLGYVFSDISLLKKALTHKSYANENKLPSTENNERLEFLGDAVLELAVSHLLMQMFAESNEGDLSKLRAAVVNETSLAALAREINLGEFLFLGKGEDQCQGRTKDSLLSDAFEAVLGAIYQDSGFPKVFPVIQKLFQGILTQAQTENILKDYKTRLQEVSQEKFRAVPVYRLVDEKGPDHDKIFHVEIIIAQQLFGNGEGKSKKQAEQNAARMALAKLGAL
ncbi:MAG: hypothetical protein ACD_73C00655G0003 [uncultured bacterium]|nr:MAG: hypothetical protein ACD_73C00655G0003 [uncultured bacterium]